MFKVRTSPVEVGTEPYLWNIPSVYQCVWYCYYRCGEKGLPYPTWWDRATETGSYTNANLWLENYRDPWEVKGKDYIPVENDIVVFNGTYGHVAFIEKVEGNRALLSQYMSGNEDSFSNYSWEIGTSYTGPLMGYLHCPYGIVNPVSRDTTKDQIETTDDTLRIRTKPTLNSEIVGHVQVGYYNVLQKTQADNYIWYEISKDRWIANITTKYHEATGEDVLKELEKYFNAMRSQIKAVTQENKDMKEDMMKIKNITERWLA